MMLRLIGSAFKLSTPSLVPSHVPRLGLHIIAPHYTPPMRSSIGFYLLRHSLT